MDNLTWCIRNKSGIQLIEQNSNLSEAYIEKAEESLHALKINTDRSWKIATAYYSMYFSLYSIMMRLGVKCEIHSCTIEFSKRLLGKYFTKNDISLLNTSLKARIDAQYYVDREVSEEQFQKMIKNAPEFFVKCKSIASRITENEISDIRSNLSKTIHKSMKQ